MGKITLRNKKVILFIFLKFTFAKSQIVLHNGGFEKSLCKKTSITKDKLTCVENWYQPSAGTPDFLALSNNYFGNQNAKEGKYYLGFYLFSPNDKYREYIAQELPSKLIKGKKYHLTFYISLADKSEYAIKNIGVAFSDTKLIYDTKRVINVTGKIFPAKDTLYSNMKDWMKIEINFEAEGTEAVMLIGNFSQDENISFERISEKRNGYAYYYIDNVTLVEINDKRN